MAETIYGDSGNNSLTGTPNADLILGFQGQDTITGNGGSDTLYGGQGADSIRYGASGDMGSPVVYGGEGADTIISSSTSGNATIVGDTGNASADSSSGGADYINAQLDSGSDIILGNYGDDTILSSTVSGNGTFGSTSPFNEVAGGYGNDIIFFAYSADLASGTPIGPGVVAGNQGNDSITFGGVATTVYGGQGDDTLVGMGTLGQARNEVIYGGEGNDVVSILGGNNTIIGGTGKAAVDSLSGAEGDGNDSINLGTRSGLRGNDLILGNYGDDTINGLTQRSGGTDTLVGGQGNDVIFAGATVNNLIFGNQGNDAVSDTLSGPGTDTIAGGMGDDTIVVGSTTAGSKDLVYGDEGSNSISVVGGGNDTIYGGNTANDAVGNGDGNNIINISSQVTGNDLIFGGSGNDSINNGSTSTTLFETVTGGVGADVFRFGNANAAASVAGTNSAVGTASGNDVITDMTSGVDKIAATGNPISNFSNIGSVTGTSLNAAAAAAEAILTQQYGAGTNAATFTYQGSTDTYAVVATSTGAGTAETTNLLVDIKATTSLAKGDFIA